MKRRSHQDWLTLFDQQTASGLSAAAFCREQHLSPRYFSKRKRALSVPRSGFVKIARLTPEHSPAAEGIALCYQSVQLHLPLSVDARWLATLLSALS